MAVNDFLRNHLWPVLGGLATALLTAISGELPARLADGFQSEDLSAVLPSLVAAALGYGLVVLQRYGGRSEPWVQPPK